MERLLRPATAWALASVVLVLAVALIPLALAAGQNPLVTAGPQIAVAVSFAAMGLVVARHRPANPIGWLMLGLALGLLIYADSGLYNVIGYRQGHRLPLAPVVLFLYQVTEPMVGLLPLIILLFPDGRLPSPRWRWVLRGYLIAATADVLAQVLMSVYAIARHRTQVDAGDHQPDAGVRDRDRAAGWGVRRAGAPNQAGVLGEFAGRGGRVHASRGRPVQPGAAAGAAGGGPPVQPGPVRRRPHGGGVRGPAE